MNPLISSLDHTPEPLFVVARSGGCVHGNPAFLALLGVARMPQWLAEFLPEFATEGLRAGHLPAVLRVVGNKTVPVRLQVQPFGIDLWVVQVIVAAQELTLSPSHLTQGPQSSDRLETLGMLAGGIAHDFNNVLTGILGHVSFLKAILPRAGDHIESLVAIEEGSRKASGMTQQILNFSKSGAAVKPSPIELGALIRSTARLLRGAVPSGCSLETTVPEFPVKVLAVEGSIVQIIINLVVNARDALAANGRIEVALSTVTDTSELRRAFGGQDLSSSSYARLAVVDNGSGISEEVQRRMFEPYFSTKKALGTGLGLATVAQIVRQFGGAIDVRSTMGQGATIAVLLPMHEVAAAAAQVTPATGSAAAVGGSPSDAPKSRTAPPAAIAERPRVLIVDDEYPVRNVLSMSLEHLGYEVATAACGTDAIELYRSDLQENPYDLVILDMLMPGMSGDEVFVNLQELDPEVRVLVMSGYSSAAAVQSILDGGGLDFMAKPFTIEDLSRKVQQCLADTPASEEG